MSEKQPLLPAVTPDRYRTFCAPMAPDEANEKLSAFADDVYELRNKHGIRDVHIILGVTVSCEDGEEGDVMSSAHFGSSLVAESMTAWAFGQEAAKRQETISKLVASSASIKTPRNRK